MQGEHTMAVAVAGAKPVLRGYSGSARRIRDAFDGPETAGAAPPVRRNRPRPPRLRRDSLGPRVLVQAPAPAAVTPAAIGERASQSRRRVLADDVDAGAAGTGQDRPGPSPAD